MTGRRSPANLNTVPSLLRPGRGTYIYPPPLPRLHPPTPPPLSSPRPSARDMQVTVSFLTVKLSLVRIPRARLHKFYYPLLRQILSPKNTFLNVTCNELELSILAESQALEDFESVAENDRKKRSRSPSRDSGSSQDLDSPSPPILEDLDCVQVCHESWNVLQIDSHSDGIGERYYSCPFHESTNLFGQISLAPESTNFPHLLPKPEFPSYTSLLICAISSL